MDLLQEYKEMYYKEIELNDRLNNKIGTNITFLSIVGTAEILLWKDMFLLPHTQWWWWVYLALSIISLCLFLLSAYSFYKSYTKYGYEYIEIEKIKKYIERAHEYANKEDISQEKTDRYIASMLKNQYITIAIENMTLNTKKNNQQYQFTRRICRAFIAVFIAYGFWAVKVNPYKTMLDEQHVQTIYVKGGEITMIDDEEKDFPKDLQPEPEARVMWETFSWHPTNNNSNDGEIITGNNGSTEE